MRISDELRLKADAIVIFPNHFAGNTVTHFPCRNGSRTENTPILIFSKMTGLVAIPSEGQIICVSLQQELAQQMSTTCSTSDW